MERGKSNLIIGLGVGSVVGALVYHFWCSPKGKKMKEKVNHAFQKVTGEGINMIDTVNDKVADGTFHIAEKADDVRNKVHTFSDKAKK